MWPPAAIHRSCKLPLADFAHPPSNNTGGYEYKGHDKRWPGSPVSSK